VGEWESERVREWESGRQGEGQKYSQPVYFESDVSKHIKNKEGPGDWIMCWEIRV